MFDDRTSRRVGAISLAVLAAAAAAVVAFDSFDLRPGMEVEVYFAHLGHLEQGADVQVAGRVIGRIKDVRLVPARLAEEPGHPLHGVGGVAVRTRIERRYASWVPVNGEFFVSSKGLIGQSYLEIGPPPTDRTRGRPIQEGDRIRGIDPPRLDRVMQRSYENLVASSLFLEAVRPQARALASSVRRLADTLKEVEPRPGAWADLGDSLSALADEGATLADNLERAELDPERVRAVIAHGRAFFSRAETEIAALRDRFEHLQSEVHRVGRGIPGTLQPKLERAVRRGRAALAKLEQTAVKARALLARVQRGEGTVGAILHDPEFIDNAKELGKIIKRQPWRVVGHPPAEE